MRTSVASAPPTDAPPPLSRRRGRPRARPRAVPDTVFAGVLAALVGLALCVPVDGPVGVVGYAGAFVGSWTVAAIGIVRNRPRRAHLWVTAAVGAAVLLVASLVREAVPGSVVAGVVTLLGYTLLAGAYGRMLRIRSRASTVGIVDAAIVGLGVFVLAWLLLIAPALAVSVPVSEAVLPVADAVLLTLAAHLATTRRAVPSERLLLVATALLAAGSAGYAANLAGAGVPVTGLDTLYALAQVFAAAAALHPSMTQVTEDARALAHTAPPRVGTRLALPTLTAVLAVAAFVVRPPLSTADRVVAGTGLAVLVTTLVVRTFRALEAQQRAAARYERLATTDTVTGLANRVGFMAHLEAAVRHDSALPWVVFFDLDAFKDVNDTYGHPVGDQLLQAVGERVRRDLREGDTVARFGGDEFAVLCPQRVDAQQPPRPLALAARVQRCLQEPFMLRTGEVLVHASIGVAAVQDHSDPSEATRQVLRDADIAMYAAKRSRSGVVVYDSSMQADAARRVRLAADLRRALGTNELSVAYQGLFDVRVNAVAGFEALVRWHHSELGPIRPDEFVGIAEEFGLVGELGRYVLRTAVEEAAVWPGDDAKISVNVSAHQLGDTGFVATVADVLEATGVAPRRLCLEVTETAMVTDVQRTTDALDDLRGLGVQIALDDFGTGYATMAQLQSLPVQWLKIDRCFVDRIGAGGKGEQIVAATIAMAHALGIRVVAEGVETAEQLHWLRTAACDVMQGYYIARPAPAEEARRLLAVGTC